VAKVLEAANGLSCESILRRHAETRDQGDPGPEQSMPGKALGNVEDVKKLLGAVGAKIE
jgi:hypothetical protein